MFAVFVVAVASRRLVAGVQLLPAERVPAVANRLMLVCSMSMTKKTTVNSCIMQVGNGNLASEGQWC